MNVRRLCAAFLILFYVAAACAEEECLPWGVTIFLAEGSTRCTENIIKDGDLHLTKTFFASAELLKQIHCWEKILFLDNVKLEIEGQIAKHWGKQHNGELTLAPVFRFNTVTWPEVISMNFAVGDGISYAIGSPKLEGVRVRTLNFLLVEGAFFMPECPQWQMVLRWHHRCKCYGLYSNQRKTGSNFFALGLRYRFD